MGVIKKHLYIYEGAKYKECTEQKIVQQQEFPFHTHACMCVYTYVCMYVCLVFLFVRICSRMYICMCVSHLHVVGDKKSPPPEGGVTCAYECISMLVSEFKCLFV